MDGQEMINKAMAIGQTHCNTGLSSMSTSKVETIIDAGIIPEGATVMIDRRRNVEAKYINGANVAYYIESPNTGKEIQRIPVDTADKKQMALVCYAALQGVCRI